ncbi:MAG: hypothetical protein JO086_05440, partial [Acidimicrobiia bacterium]|nr:hypothetical protein [Acidimicrobiia bacterium]
AAGAVLLARIPSTDPIAHSLRVGQEVLAHQADPAAAAVNVPATPTTLAAAPVPPPPPPPIDVLAIGDSVMVGAAPALQARLGPGGYIDAHIGRQFDEGIQVVKTYHDRGRLGRAVVVHLGDNGPIRPTEVDALLDQLAGVPNVVLVNVRVARPWQDEVNQTLADAVARHPGVKLVDWFGFSAPHGDWFESDHTHLKESGMAAFADAVASAVPPPSPPTTVVDRHSAAR